MGPFSLASYAEVKKRAAQIALVVDRRIMPPWKLDSHGEFQGERRLTDREISTIKQWVAEGAAQGRQSDLPPAPTFPTTWALGKPDLLLQPATDYHLASEGRDVYRCFVIPTHFDEDRYVSAIDINPGNRAVVHHVLVYLDTEGRARKMDSKESEPGYSTGGGIGFLPSGMLGGWAPGAMPTHLPKETGILLPKGADVVLEVHYHKDGKPEIDRSQVALYFSKQPVERPLHLFPLANLGIRIPADKKDHEEKASLVVPLGVTLYTLFPHMHNLGKQMSVTATLPGGTKKQLIHIPDWDFNWQGFYAYKQPVPLPAGTRVDLVAHYDNSADNPLNPNSPPKDLTWGEQTSDEMCLCFLGFTVDIERLPQKPVGNQIKNASSIQPTTDSRKPLETEAVGQSDSVAPSDPLAAAKGKKALVLFFVGTDCPISNAYAPEIKRISDSYKRQNIAFALVYPDPDLSLMEAKKHAKAYGYTCPVFIDPSHRLTRQAGATLTPQVAVLAPGGSVLYRGRINNLYVDFGKRRFEATQHDLRSALDAIVAGKAVRERFTNAIGCFIPEKK
ncbi:redoxin family protein [Armatimonas sp.]|uniref:redoxin family protein n=1 Tax=Armatimonas sp. TaxID=1872638 RepID=UPI0037535016